MGAVLTAWAGPLVLGWDIWEGLHGALGWSGAIAWEWGLWQV